MTNAVTLTRRRTLQFLASLIVVSPRAAGVAAQEKPARVGAVQPEEKVEATLTRLFGDRPLKPADAVTLDAPLIAENGAVVPVTVEATVPMLPERHAKAIYIIADRNFRPLIAKFTLTPAVGQAFVGTTVRLGASGNLRGIVELSDGTLLMAQRDVKVTVGGCGG